MSIRCQPVATVRQPAMRLPAQGTSSGASGADKRRRGSRDDRRSPGRGRPGVVANGSLPGDRPIWRPVDGCAGQLQLRPQSRHARRRQGRLQLHARGRERRERLDHADDRHRAGRGGRRRPGSRRPAGRRRAVRHPRQRPRPRHQHARRHADGDPERRRVRSRRSRSATSRSRRPTSPRCWSIPSRSRPPARRRAAAANSPIRVPPLDPGVPLGDLIPPTELGYTPPEFQELGPGFDDTKPTVIIETPDNPPGAVDASESGQREGPAGAHRQSGQRARGLGRNRRRQSVPTTATPARPTAARSCSLPRTASTASPSTASRSRQVGQTIQGQFGTMTITGIDLANGQITYSYTLARQHQRRRHCRMSSPSSSPTMTATPRLAR